MGLTKRDDRNTRLLPDGRAMEIVVETSGSSTEQTDVLQLIRDTWAELGVRLFIKPSQLEIFRMRIFAGETVMAISSGLDDGIPVAEISPAELAPTEEDQLQWPKWGDYYETHGKTGEAVDLPEASELLALNKEWETAASHEERTRIWQRMLEINADQQFTIGIVAAVPQPVVVSNHLENVAEKGIYCWDPGAHFGIYKPDTFWFDNAPAETAAVKAAAP